MKKTILVLGLLVFFISAQAGSITVHVKGMVCGFCAQGLEKKFKALSEVQKVMVDLTKKVVVLDMNEKKDLTDPKITEIISENGFNVEKIERKP